MDDDASLWTIDQLSEQVAAALAVGYQGAASGRVRDVPDPRTIRWYATIGLVDRPVAMRGRTALYDRRHLTQLVAIKRLQAEGRSLASIQRELSGARPATVEGIAQLPAELAAAAPVHRPEAAGVGTTAVPAVHRFWTAVPAGAPAASPMTAAGTAHAGPAHLVSDLAVHGIGAVPRAPMPPPVPAPAAELVPAIRLGPGVALLLTAAGRAPDQRELTGIVAAARPLLEALNQLGLTGSELTAPSFGEDPQ